MGKGNMCLNGYVRMCRPKNWGMEFMDFEWLLRTDPKTTEEHIGDCCYWIRLFGLRCKYDCVGVLRNGVATVLDHTIGKCNFADKNGVLLLDDNWIKYFDNPSKRYKIVFDGKEAYINSRGELFDSNE